MDSEQPVCAAKQPAILDLEPGTYSFCACGKSAQQPFCDGSHRGGPFRPVTFQVSEKKKSAFCLCKQTRKAPYCDGTHKTLP